MAATLGGTVGGFGTGPEGVPPFAALEDATVGRASGAADGPPAEGFTAGAGAPEYMDPEADRLAPNVDDMELGSAASAAGTLLVVRATTCGAPGKFPIATVAVPPLATGSGAASSGDESATAAARAVVVGCLPAASA